MSVILKGLIATELKNSFGDELYAEQVDKYAGALAKAIQTYLKASVFTISAPGPVSHIHSLDPK